MSAGSGDAASPQQQDRQGHGDGPAITGRVQRTKKQVIRVGTRKSQLAMIQTNFVISELKRLLEPDAYEYEIVSMTTTGDHILDKPLSQIGSKALFTKELEDSLLSGEIDFIVHSLKDLPTSLPDGCCIGAILKRENPCDALVVKRGLNFADPFNAIDGKAVSTTNKNLVVGTSSLRRIAQLRLYNPNVTVVDIRGNLNTRLAKLDSEELPYDALILACAGLIRGGFSDRISLSLGLDPDRRWYHAVGQGALAIECRSGDGAILGVLAPLLHYETIFEALAERSLMYTLEGGCSVPIGVRCVLESSEKRTMLRLYGAVFSLDGKEVVSSDHSVVLPENLTPQEDELVANGSMVEPKAINLTGFALPKCPLLLKRYQACNKLGSQLAKTLSDLGADRILTEIKASRGDHSNEVDVN